MNDTISDTTITKIYACLENESSFRKNNKYIIDRIAYSDKNVVVTAVDTIKKIIKDKKEEPPKKFLALLLLKECMDTKSPEIVIYVQKKLLSRLVTIAKGDRANVFNAKSDPFLVNRFIQLLLECISEWANIHGLDPNNKSITQYKKLYQELVAKGIKFPSVKTYFKDGVQEQNYPSPNKSVNQEQQQQLHNSNTKNRSASPSIDMRKNSKAMTSVALFPNSNISMTNNTTNNANINKPMPLNQNKVKPMINQINASSNNSQQLIKDMNENLNQLNEYKDLLYSTICENDTSDEEILKVIMDELIRGRKKLENSMNGIFQQEGEHDEEFLNKIINEISLLGQVITNYTTFQRNKNYQVFKSNIIKILQPKNKEDKKDVLNPTLATSKNNDSRPPMVPQQKQSSQQREVEPKDQGDFKPSKQQGYQESSIKNNNTKELELKNEMNKKVEPENAKSNEDFMNFAFGFNTAPIPQNLKPQNTSGAAMNRSQKLNENTGNQMGDVFGFDFGKPKDPNLNGNNQTSTDKNTFQNLWGGADQPIPNLNLSKIEKKGFGFDDFEDIKMDTHNDSMSIDHYPAGFDFDYDGNFTNRNSKHQDSNKPNENKSPNRIDDNKPISANVNPDSTRKSKQFDVNDLFSGNQSQQEQQQTLTLTTNQTPKLGILNFDFGKRSNSIHDDNNNLPNFFGVEPIEKSKPINTIRSQKSNGAFDTILEDLNNDIKNTNKMNINYQNNVIQIQGLANQQQRQGRYEGSQQESSYREHINKDLINSKDQKLKIIGDIDDDKNQSIISATQTLQRSMIRYDELECERLKKERDRILSEMDQYKKSYNELKVEYDHIYREHDMLSKNNALLKNELNDAKKILNEYNMSTQQIHIENDNLRHMKDNLLKENDNLIKKIKELTKENNQLKEQLIDNGTYQDYYYQQQQHASDGSRRGSLSQGSNNNLSRMNHHNNELDKIIEIYNDKIKLIEEQNKLLVQKYNKNLEDNVANRFNTIKEATNMIIEKFHMSLNNYVNKENNANNINNKIDQSIMNSLSPSKSLLNAALNDTKRIFSNELLDLSRNTHIEPRSGFKEKENENRMNAMLPPTKDKSNRLSFVSPIASTLEKSSPNHQNYLKEYDIRKSETYQKQDLSLYNNGQPSAVLRSLNLNIDQDKINQRVTRDAKILTKSVDFALTQEPSKDELLLYEATKLNGPETTKHITQYDSGARAKGHSSNIRHTQYDSISQSYTTSKFDANKDTVLKIEDDLKTANNVLERAKKLRAETENHLNKKLVDGFLENNNSNSGPSFGSIATNSGFDIDKIKFSIDSNSQEYQMPGDSFRLDTKILDPTEKISVNEKCFVSHLVQQPIYTPFENKFSVSNFSQPQTINQIPSSLSNIPPYFGTSYINNIEGHKSIQSREAIPENKRYNSVKRSEKPANIQRNKLSMDNSAKTTNELPEHDMPKERRKFRLITENGENINTSATNLFKKLNLSASKAIIHTINQLGSSKNHTNKENGPMTVTPSSEFPKSVSMVKHIKEYDADPGIKLESTPELDKLQVKVKNPLLPSGIQSK